MIATAIRQVFAAASGAEASERLREVVEWLAGPAPKVATLLEEAEPDVLAFFAFPREHWSKLRSTNPLERVNREIGRRSDVVGIFPDDRALIRLAASLRCRRSRSPSSSRTRATDERRCERSRRLERPSPLPTSVGYTTTGYLTSYSAWRKEFDASLGPRPLRSPTRGTARQVQRLQPRRVPAAEDELDLEVPESARPPSPSPRSPARAGTGSCAPGRWWSAPSCAGSRCATSSR